MKFTTPEFTVEGTAEEVLMFVKGFGVEKPSEVGKYYGMTHEELAVLLGKGLK